ncbi:MAG: hypothetical protein FIB05_15865 [Betaproteobacteria bacterium]|nr:hypothetical protein [Betaproteobacteria bacterium]
MHSNPDFHPRAMARPGRNGFPQAIDSAGVIADAMRLARGGQAPRALALLGQAILLSPLDEDLWIARLAILADGQASAAFLAAVREYLDFHPDSPRFPEIVGLWKSLPDPS